MKRAAKELSDADRPPSASTEEKLRTTLHAVATSDEARDAFAGGRLATDFAASGFGAIAAPSAGTRAGRKEEAEAGRAEGRAQPSFAGASRSSAGSSEPANVMPNSRQRQARRSGPWLNVTSRRNAPKRTDLEKAEKGGRTGDLMRAGGGRRRSAGSKRTLARPRRPRFQAELSRYSPPNGEFSPLCGDKSPGPRDSTSHWRLKVCIATISRQPAGPLSVGAAVPCPARRRRAGARGRSGPQRPAGS